MDKLSFPEARTPQIQVESWSNLIRILQVRGFTRDGTLSHDHTTAGDRSRKSTIFDVSDIPPMLQVSPTTVGVRRGECYVRVTLLMAGFAVGRLIAGYVTDGATLAWPGGKFENFTDGAGLPRVITGTNPAAGANVLEIVPTNTRWRIKSISIYLTTDATVAIRTVKLSFDDGATGFVGIMSTSSQSQNAGIFYDYFIGSPKESAATVGHVNIALPHDLTLFQGWRFSTYTINLQAGDDYIAPVFMVEEWIEE